MIAIQSRSAKPQATQASATVNFYIDPSSLILIAMSRYDIWRLHLPRRLQIHLPARECKPLHRPIHLFDRPIPPCHLVLKLRSSANACRTTLRCVYKDRQIKSKPLLPLSFFLLSRPRSRYHKVIQPVSCSHLPIMTDSLSVPKCM